MVTTSLPSAQEVLARVAQSAQTRTEKNLHRLEFRAMSTRCQVNFHGVSAELARDFQREVVAWVAQFEARYSRFIPDSLIGRINAAAGEHWVETDAETDRLFNLCQELYLLHSRLVRSDRSAAHQTVELESKSARRPKRLTPFKPHRNWSAGTKSSAGPAAFFCRNAAWRLTSAASARNTPWTA